MIERIFDKLGITSGRTRNIARHIGWSSLFKAGSVIANFLLVPLTIDYLSTNNYGIWLVLSSVISWFSFFDVGLGHGLRNKFAEAKALGNIELAKAYVSCAYFTIGTVALCLILLFLLANNFLNWAAIFSVRNLLSSELSILMPIIFTFFSLQLVLKLIVTIYVADQHHSIQIKIEFITRLLSLMLIWLLIRTTQSSLLIFGSIFSAVPVLILIILNFLGFKGRYQAFKPSFRLWKKSHLKDILGIGMNFFIIQVSVLILLSTDNLIIIKLFSSTEVVPYNLAYKYFSLMVVVYNILTAPYWSSFTEAYAKRDFSWITKSSKNLLKIWFFVPFGLGIMLLIADWFYLSWVGENIKVPFDLSLAMSFFALLMTFNMIYVYFINGIGKIRLQLWLGVISIIINIPLSIFFSQTLELGLSGIILATCVSLLLQAILYPIQYYKIINNKARGIWNK